MKKIFSDILIFLSIGIILGLDWLLKNYPMHLQRTVYFVMTSDISGHDSGTFFSILKGFIIPTIIIFAIYKVFQILFLRFRLKSSQSDFTKNSSVILSAVKKFPLFLFAVSLIFLFFSLKAFKYPFIFHSVKKTPENSTFYKENFIDPKTITFSAPQKKRNLLLIFMESIESTFNTVENGGAFEKTPMPYLYSLAEENINFSPNEKIGGGKNIEGTTWTVAGLLSKTCALPYFQPFTKIDGKTVCLKNTKSLFDVLNDFGYKSVLSIGSEKQFENRDALFESHNTEIHDINYYKEIGLLPKDYQVFWGFEDAKLYEFAKIELNNLSEQDLPFCYSFLTVDTHFPYGYQCENCKQEYKTPMMNVLQCADNLLKSFLDWAKEQNWYDNTTIVILGDHNYLNAPNNNFINEVSKLSKKEIKNRRYFMNVIINSAVPIEKSCQKNRIFSSLDIAPTILSALGFSNDKNAFALGRSLFTNEKTLLEKYSQNYVEKELMKRTVQYDELK